MVFVSTQSETRKTNARHIPKLDVAGSRPVARSCFANGGLHVEAAVLCSGWQFGLSKPGGWRWEQRVFMAAEYSTLLAGENATGLPG
jgi:hypothetical protein